MRLTLDSPTLKDVRAFVQQPFASPLPSAALLRTAWADPQVRVLFSVKNRQGLGLMLQQTALTALQSVNARVAIHTGVPSGLLDAFAQTLSATAYANDTQKWAELATNLAKSITDTAIDAIGAVPIVGWIAKGVYALLDILIARATANKPKPMLIDYDRDVDEDIARQALSLLSEQNADWTPLFSPFATGPWKRTEAENGWIATPQNATGGFGCLPTGATGFRVVQVRGMALPTAPTSSEAYRKDVLERTGDTWDQLPSLQRVCLAAWSAVSSTKTAAIFNLRPWVWSAQWADYFAGGLELTGGNERDALYLHLTGAGRVSSVPLRGGKNVSGGKFAEIAYAAADRLMGRQLALLQTPVVAYASEGQAVFGFGSMRQKLIDGRKQLLTTLDANAIDPQDVLDADFRTALTEYQGPRSGHMPGRPAPLSLPPPDFTPKPSGSGLVGVAIVIGAVAAAVRLRRRK